MATLAADNIHWSGHDLLTRNAMWSYAIGGRGVGKTYYAKTSRIKHFLKTGKQWIYMRRYETEFADKAEFLNDVAGQFPGYEFRIDGMRMCIRRDETDEDGKALHAWEVMGFFVALSTTIAKKSVPYPGVDYIVFDEFIIDKGFIRYMRNEVKMFLEFYNTVDRFTDRVRCLFLANAVSAVNPYFVYFKINPRHGVRFCSAMNGYHVCEMIESEAFAERVSQTKFGQMIRQTEYYDYAVGNVFTNDQSALIRKKPKDAVCIYGVTFDGQTVGIWRDRTFRDWYVTGRVSKDKAVYVITRADQSPDTLMIDRSMPLLKSLKTVYMMGQCFFENARSKAIFDDILNYLNLR